MIALTEESGKLDEQYDIIHKKSHVIGEQQKQINILEEQRRLLRQQRYGKSSEKNAAQGELFNEVEQLADQPEPEDIDAESSTDQPKKKKKGRTGLSPCTWLSVSAPALLYLLCPYSRPTLRVLCLIRLLSNHRSVFVLPTSRLS